jgi:hypothetical protein
MKKYLLISCMLILLSGCTFNKQASTKIDEKHYCNMTSDCILSGSGDPEGFNTCINKDWAKEEANDPKSEKVLWECISNGKEKCGCIDNKCQRTDSEPSC